MARLVSIFRLVALISLIGAFAHAQDIDCDHIRTCSSLLQHYQTAAAACVAEVNAYHCTDANRQTDYGKYIRDCSPETMCKEAKWFSTPLAAIPGCTGVIQQKAEETMDGARACYQAGVVRCSAAFFPEFGKNLVMIPVNTVVGFVSFVSEGLGIVAHPVETAKDTKANAQLFNRGWACFNPEGRFRMLCDLAGGTFSRVMMGRMLMGGVRAAATRLVEEDPVITARRARVTGRAHAETGAPAPRPAVITTVRQRTRAGAVAAAVSDFADTKKMAAAVTRPPTEQAENQRQHYLDRLIGRQATTVEQRRAFEQLAFNAEARDGMVFVDMQNSKMKYLNDHLGDKNVVTAITNARIQSVFEELRSSYPELEKIEYDDFKSARIGFSFKDKRVPPGFVDALKAAMGRAETKFIAELGEFDIVPKGSDLLPPNQWFSSGIGLTPDEANIACRYAARTCSTTPVDFRNSRVAQNLAGRLQQTDTLRSGVMKAISSKDRLIERLPNGQIIPSMDVYEAYRKAHSSTEFAQMIADRTGQSITVGTATNLRNYLKGLDEWSTGLLITEQRQSASLAGAKFNGVTIDISGMGALNMRELAASLAGETDAMNAIPRAREAERRATATFERNKQTIVDTARETLRARGIEVDIRVSGDDIVVRPTNRAMDGEAEAALQDAIARSSSSSNVRMSAVESGAANADHLAVRGEDLEKKTRLGSLSEVTDQARYMLQVSTNRTGVPTLRVSARTGEVDPAAEAAFQRHFRESLANGAGH